MYVCLVLLYSLRFKLAFSISGDIKVDLPDGEGDGLSAVTVSAVVGFLVFVVITWNSRVFHPFRLPTSPARYLPTGP